MKQVAVNRNASQQGTTIVSGRTTFLVALCAASLLGMLVPIAVAQEGNDRSAQPAAAASVTAESAQSALDFAAWPPLDLITAQTNVAVFFRPGVPAELRLAALRRAWKADPAIRDFKGLSENEWDFNDPNSIPGFGDLRHEVDVRTMVAEILGTPTRVAALSLTRSYEPTSSSSVANAVRRLVFGTVHN